MLLSKATSPPEGARWAFEVKWDGFRALCHLEGSRPRFTSRRGADLTQYFPELASAPWQPATSVVLDGEVVAMVDGRPSFSALRERVWGRRHGGAGVAFVAFDVLWIDGHPLLDVPYEQRRELLDLFELDDDRWQTSPWFAGEAGPVYDATRELGLEGMVAKRLGSAYRCGERSPDWVKVPHFSEGDFVVVGWTPTRRGNVMGLALAHPVARAGDRLRFAALVEYGFRRGERERLATLLARLERAEGLLPRTPSRPDLRHVEPVVTVRARYIECQPDGVLRHASYRGLVTPSHLIRIPPSRRSS